MNIAIIPARGGSKRVPGKNIRSFCGQPMIAWSIQAALQSDLFEKVIVTTDCLEIANVARQHGAATPFVRPDNLSDDFTPTIPVVRHAIDWLCENDTPPENICCIYATAPFVQPKDLKQGLDLLQQDSELEFVFPVTEFPASIFRGLKMEGDSVSMLWPENELTRTQDLTPAYHDVGQFYWGRREAYRNNEGFYSARSSAIVLPAHRVQDIDTPDDWTRAESMFKAMQTPLQAPTQSDSISRSA